MIMKLMKVLAMALVMFAAVGCFPEEEITEYPELESLEDTLWYSYDGTVATYYDVLFESADEGVMVGYNSAERIEEVSRQAFGYSFDAQIDVVTLDFVGGKSYGGILVPKGEFQISEKDVYIIQLYEVDENGDVIYTAEGEIQSTLLMWKE